MQAPAPAGNRVNLKLLQTFMMVAENRSFRAAANRMNRSQSAVSAQIRQLEDQLGLPLFNRTTRSVRLTPEGEDLLDHARRAVGEVESGLRHILEAADLRRGRVTIACAPTLASTRLPPVLAAFERAHPGIRIVLQELKSVELFQRVRRGEVDFGVGPMAEDAELGFQTILRERLHLFGSARFIPEDRPTIGFDELAGLPLIQFPPTTVVRRIVAAKAAEAGIVLNTRYECVHGQTQVALAKAGLGAAIVTHTVALSAAGGGMRAPLIIEPEITQDFAIVTLKGKALSPAAAGLAGIIAASMRVIG